jgi:hypothetical protein
VADTPTGNDADSYDWRVTITPHDEADVQHALRSLSEHEMRDDERRRLGHHVAVSAGDGDLFLYTDSEAAAHEAERVARELLTGKGVSADYSLDRWHPIEEGWESADKSLPQSAEQQETEHERLVQSETADSFATGVAQWQVRAELPSHHDAMTLAASLHAEGFPVLRRWKYLIVGENNEDQAKDVAAQVESQVPGSSARVDEVAPHNPFVLWPEVRFP